MADIWICNPFDNLVGEGARPQRYALLASELARRGHRVVWWSSDFNHLKKTRRQRPDGTPLPACHRTEDGVSIRLLETPPYRSNVGTERLRSHRAFARRWEAEGVRLVESGELPPPALLVVSLPPLGTHAVARAFRERWGAAVVVDVQDAWPENFEGLLPLPPPLRHLAWTVLFASARRVARAAYRLSDGLSAVGEGYLALADRYGAVCPRHLCLLGIDGVVDSVEGHGPEEPLRLVYAGNMGSRVYDLGTLLRAVGRLQTAGKGVELDLAGAGPSEERLRALASGRPAIRFHGFLGKGALRDLFRSCDVGVIPMFDRSLVAIPNKVADYAASGLAVLNSLTGETARLLSRYDAGTGYRAGDVASCAAAIMRLHENRSGLEEMRRKSVRMAREVFLAEAIYPRFADFLEQRLPRR